MRYIATLILIATCAAFAGLASDDNPIGIVSENYIGFEPSTIIPYDLEARYNLPLPKLDLSGFQVTLQIFVNEYNRQNPGQITLRRATTWFEGPDAFDRLTVTLKTLQERRIEYRPLMGIRGVGSDELARHN